MTILRTALFAAAMLLTAGSAHAETLDDQSIREFYATQTAFASDNAKTQAWLAERLSEDYVIEGSTLTVVDGHPPEKTQSTTNKQETMANSAQMRGIMTQKSNESTVQAIRFEDNGRTAQVDVLASSTGIIDLPVEEGRRVTLQYEVGNACRDTLALQAGKIKYKRSSCDTKVNFTK